MELFIATRAATALDRQTRATPSRTLALAVIAVLASSAAMAAEQGWYVGGNVGQSKAKIDDDRIISSLLGAGITTTSIAEDETDLGYKLFGGYQFNKYLALEGGYFDLGKFGFTATTVPAGSLSGELKVKGLNFDIVGFVPMTEKLSAFARAGVNYAETNATFGGTGAVNVLDPRRSKSDGNYKFGLGLQYDFNPSFAMRAEVERYRINDAVGNNGDIDLGSLGVLFRFGGAKPAEVVHAAPAPTPVVYAEPVKVVVPVPAQTERYCSILDLQFEINQDDIERADKEKLRVVGTFLEKYPNTTAVIEGHTDNVGAPADNLQLSQRRANSVVSYLTETFHVAPARLTAVGYGETRPIGDNNTAEGKRMNRRIGAIVACATDIEGLKVLPERMTMAVLIEFDRNKADVKPEYRDALLRVANFMKANPSVTAAVEGHTGNLQATAEAAREIAQRRAQNVVNYLVDNFGIARTRLTAEGFGKTRRFAYNTSLEGQQENRRVNVIINYPK
jgi:OOP family OmpA-OmpF porin